ncbi:nucleolar protein Nop52 family protein [Schizosaccharomyces japonicus yFS275]|uniref:Nucleolar protein Nop52 family protein n=1 Tax=Schizosaccharomyces japonicus (strain yFS275 / FY16936) TaxID=402676 RepID=B6K4A5_SCHJY|nr:nucleolar protein Nop52 family protein [Schizosaccharomyces japonicus yFS275]EEB08312.1 nucleolar protein Nop52 family protein [Schizosaccharomyces japonicus yFS275]
MSSQSPFIKRLAANDRKTRDSALESLQRFLSQKKPFTKMDFLKLWKGLFYCMWMADKPRYQQQLAQELADLTPFLRPENRLLFLQTFWETMGREWVGLDALRIDKFYSLMRRFANAGFKNVKVEGEQKGLDEALAEYNQMLIEGPFDSENLSYPAGVIYHLCDLWTDELKKVYEDDVPKAEWYKPFDHILETSKRTPFKNTIIKRLERLSWDE